MPIGIFINSFAIILGGVVGYIISLKRKKGSKNNLIPIFGCIAIGLGVSLVTKAVILPAITLSIILGSLTGEFLKLEGLMLKLSNIVQRFLSIIPGFSKKDNADSDFLSRFSSLVVLFAMSAMGIFGALNEGLSGDHSLLLTKAMLDFVTSTVFATSLGLAVSMIFIPQFTIQISLYLLASLIAPYLTDTMKGDLSACGGIILIATGLRIAGIKDFPVANMLPSLLYVMPISYLWIKYITF